MSPLDKQLIIRKAKLIEIDLDKLKEFKSVTESKYVEAEHIQLQVERLLERIIGRLIDINYHLLKEKYAYLPNDYYDSYIKLGEKGIVDKDLSQKLAKSVGLRNILAHEYDEIDPVQVFQSIKMALTQIPKYLKQILIHLNKD